MSEYKTIPGFSRYRINTETKEVQSNATNIRNKGSFVCNVSAYIRKVIRTLYAQKLRVNKLLRSYDDNQARLSRMI